MLDHEIRYKSAVASDAIATVFGAVAVSEQLGYLLEVNDKTSAFMAVIELQVESVSYYRMHRAMLATLALPFTRTQSGVFFGCDAPGSEFHYLVLKKEFARGSTVQDVHDAFMTDVSGVLSRLNSDDIPSALVGPERLLGLCGSIVGVKWSGQVKDEVTLVEAFHEIIADSPIYSASPAERAFVEGYSAQQMSPGGSTARVLTELRSANLSCPWHLRTHCTVTAECREVRGLSSWTCISAVAPSVSDRKALGSAVTFLEYDGFCFHSDGQNSALFNLLGIPGVHACGLERTVGRFKTCSRDTAARRLVMSEDAELVAQPMNPDLDASLRCLELGGVRNLFIAYSGAGIVEAAALLNSACDVAVWNRTQVSLATFVEQQRDSGAFKKSYTRCPVAILFVGDPETADWLGKNVIELTAEAQQLGTYVFAVVNPASVTPIAASALSQSLCFLLPSGNIQSIRDVFMNGIDMSASDELYYTLDTNEKPADNMLTVFLRLSSSFQKTAIRTGV